MQEPIYSNKNKFQTHIDGILQAARKITQALKCGNTGNIVNNLHIYEYILSKIMRDLLLYCNYDKSVPDLDWYIISFLEKSKVHSIDLNKLVLFIKKGLDHNVNKKEIEKVILRIIGSDKLKHFHAEFVQNAIEMTDVTASSLLQVIIPIKNVVLPLESQILFLAILLVDWKLFCWYRASA